MDENINSPLSQLTILHQHGHEPLQTHQFRGFRRLWAPETAVALVPPKYVDLTLETLHSISDGLILHKSTSISQYLWPQKLDMTTSARQGAAERSALLWMQGSWAKIA